MVIGMVQSLWLRQPMSRPDRLGTLTSLLAGTALGIWQASPVTSPVPPQNQILLAESSRFGSSAWRIGQPSPHLPSSSLPNNGPSPPFLSPGFSYIGMKQPPTVGYAVSRGQDPQAGPTSSSRVPLWNRDNDRCHRCRKRGHWKVECPDRRQRQMAQGACAQRSGTRTYLGISVYYSRAK